MSASDDFRTQVIAGLRQATEAHARGKFNEIGAISEKLARTPPAPGSLDDDLLIALAFLDGWYDSSNHEWAFYEPFECDDWPRLSHQLAQNLESAIPVDSVLRERFSRSPRA